MYFGLTLHALGVSGPLDKDSSDEYNFISYTCYEYCIRLSLLMWLEAFDPTFSVNNFAILCCSTGDKDDQRIWQHQQKVLLEEYPSNLPLSFLLQELLSQESMIVNAVAKCRSRDAIRGAEIIPDYDAVHTPTDNDKVVVAVRERLRSMQEEIEKLLEEGRGKDKFEGPYEAWLEA